MSEPTATTLAEALFDEWVSWLRGAGFKRASTVLSYQKWMKTFIRVTETTDFATVTTRDLDSYVARLQFDGLSKSTIRAKIFALRTFFRWAVSHEYLAKNPAAADLLRIPPDDRNDRPVVVLDKKELARLFDAAGAQTPERGKREPERFFKMRVAKHAGQAERDKALLLVSYAAALRVSEAAALRWEDVLAPDKRDGGLAIVLRSSKRSDRASKPLYLGTAASLALLEWKAARAAAGKTGPLVFGLNVRGCSAVFNRCYRLAGLFRVGHRLTPHALRSSRASHASRAGLSDHQVADLLRHRNLESVLRYVKADDETRRRALALASLPENDAKKLARPRI